MIHLNKFYAALMAHWYLFFVAVIGSVFWVLGTNPVPILWVSAIVYSYEAYRTSIVVSVPKKDGFEVYTGKPVAKLAYRVGLHDQIMALEEPCTSEISIGGVVYAFKHYEEVKAGDYVVFLSDTDIYHCAREVFLERNMV